MYFNSQPPKGLQWEIYRNLLCHTTKTQDVFFTNDADRSQKIQKKTQRIFAGRWWQDGMCFFCEQNVDVSNGLVWCVFFVVGFWSCLIV